MQQNGATVDLQEIRYFLALVRTRNFTRAAEACHVTQPALTRAIQRLEEQIGGQLFVRDRANTHLTQLGRLLAPQFESLLDREAEARQTAARFLRLNEAPMTIGVMCTIGPLRFAEYLSNFRLANPGIEVTITEAVPDKLCDMLIAGEADVAILARPDGVPEPLVAHPLYRERFVVACSGTHRFATRGRIDMAEMDGEIYLRRINCEFRDVLGEALRSVGANIMRSYQSEREDWVQALVAADMGVCFMPEHSVSQAGVVACHVENPEITRDVSLVTVAGRRWTPPVAAFVKAARAHAWA